MSGIAVVTAHPADQNILVVRPPYDPTGRLMSGFEAATYSQARSGYLVDRQHMPDLERWLDRHHIRLVDDRQTDRPTETRLNPGNRRCPDHGDQPCPPGVPFGEWAGRHPEEARELLDGLDAIKHRTRSIRTQP